jgi:beta-lactamase class A
VSTAVADVFGSVGCDGSLLVQAEDGRSVEHEADSAYVAASVIKVLIAVEVERRIGAGDIDPLSRIGLPAIPRTAGPVGFSLYQDPVEVSIRDLLVSMLTISDNVATDALLQVVGLAGCNATAHELGLEQTSLVCNLQAAIDQIGQAAGFADYATLTQWSAGEHSPDELARVDAAASEAASLQPDTATATSARDLVRLLDAIWTDRAAPPEGCRRIRSMMGYQLTRHRIASGFDRSVSVAAKSGGLAGIYRHEVGVVRHPANGRFLVAVLTKTRPGHAGDQAINAAIGQAARVAVDELTAPRK